MLIPLILLLSALRPIKGTMAPTPASSPESVAVLSSEIAPSIVEERQLVLLGITLGAYGLGIISGRLSQSIKTIVAFKPGPNRAPGSGCISQGGWFKQASVDGLTDTACTLLMNRALTWTNPNQANPNAVFRNDINGSTLMTEDGYTMLLTFAVFDSNGNRARPWITQEACVVAFTTLLYDCSGEHDDTIGGGYFYGHDGVVGYQLFGTVAFSCLSSLAEGAIVEIAKNDSGPLPTKNGIEWEYTLSITTDTKR